MPGPKASLYHFAAFILSQKEQLFQKRAYLPGVSAITISISSLMVAVLIVALNLGVGKAVTNPDLVSRPLSETILIAVFPMGNIILIGLAILWRHPKRTGLRGFEILNFVACAPRPHREQ